MIDSNYKNAFPESYTEITAFEPEPRPDNINLSIYDFVPNAGFQMASTTYFNLVKSPLNILLELFSIVDNYAVFQVIIMPMHSSCYDKVQEAIDIDWQNSRPLDNKLPPSMQRADEKLKYKSPEHRSHFAVCIRIILPTDEHIDKVKAFIANYSYGNKHYKIFDNSHYSQEQIWRMFAYGEAFHSGMCFNPHELTGFLHTHCEALDDKKFTNVLAVMPAGDKPDKTTQYEGIPIGTWDCGNSAVKVHLPKSFEIPHTHVMGVSRSGKSILLQDIAVQKFMSGESVIIADMHGDLAVNILKLIPEERINDVVYIDFGLDVTPQLTIRQNIDIQMPSLFADNMADAMRTATVKNDMFGAQMLYRFSCCYFIYCICPDLSLPDIRTLLSKSEKGRNLRAKIIARMDHPIIIEFLKEIESTPFEILNSVITRLSTLLLDTRSLKFFCVEENKISLSDIMSQGKMCIINLSIGKVGKNRGMILMGVMDSLINNNILARASLDYDKRTPVTLIKDEFYLGPGDLDMQLTGLAKYNLNVIFAHQYLNQVEGRTRDVMATAGTRIGFKLNQEDAEKMGFDFSIDPHEFTSLDKHTAIVKIEDEVVKIKAPRPCFPKDDFSDEIIRLNIEKYYQKDETKKKNKSLEKDQILLFDTLK